MLRRPAVAFALVSVLTATFSGAPRRHPAAVVNVVLVHGAFVDASGWRPVYEILTAHGFRVAMVQEPLTSLENDVVATTRVLDRLDGSCVLVGHSYGGAVITAAGVHPRVAALVYIAAHALDKGETEAGNGKRFPNSIRPLVTTPDGFVFLDPANFPSDFAADLPRSQSVFMAYSQVPAAAAVFTTPARRPAWKVKPTWYMVAASDKVINPALERMYATRAHSHSVEVPNASHAVYISHPAEVAALIEDAAQHVSR
jgi:pimeloyl-ACP methyl ester carboxylesterase